MKAEITPLKLSDIDAIVALASPIWHEHYTPIIGSEQVDYMLEKFQSSQAINNQIDEGYQYYRVDYQSRLMGYFSIQERDESSLFISKFYLAKQARGEGLGKDMLMFVEQLARDADCKTLDLTVNKHNPAYQIYLKLGFQNKGAAEFDIGGGYIMDDYMMSKKLSL